MIQVLETALWAATWVSGIVLTIRQIDKHLSVYFSLKQPLAEQHTREIVSEINKLKQQIARLSLAKGFEQHD